MRELHEEQIIVLRKIFNRKALEKPLDIRVNRIHYPGTMIQKHGDKFWILLTEKGKDNTEIANELKSPNERIKHYIITINTIRQLQAEGYLYLVKINDINASYDLNKENENGAKLYEFQDIDFNTFLNKYFYATIFPTNELLDYILYGETIEARRHTEQMQEAKAQTKWSIAAFMVALIALIVSLRTTPTIDKTQIQEIIDQMDKIENTRIPAVIDTRIINDTLKVDIVTKRQSNTSHKTTKCSK